MWPIADDKVIVNETKLLREEKNRVVMLETHQQTMDLIIVDVVVGSACGMSSSNSFTVKSTPIVPNYSHST